MFVLDTYCRPHLHIQALCVGAGNYVGDKQTNCRRLEFKGAVCLVGDQHFPDWKTKS